MRNFFVYLSPTNFGATPPALKLAIDRYRSNVFGGPESAGIVSTRGPKAAYWAALDWLGREVTLYNDHSSRVWWGIINTVQVVVDGVSVTLTLDGMYNRIAAAYSFEEANGASNGGVTAWQEDATSIARYGYKELLYTIGNADGAAAAVKVTKKLTKRRNPRRKRTLTSDLSGIHLDCIGLWETLGWRYFTRLEGRIVWQGNGGQQYIQNIGWGLVGSSLIGFATGSLHDVGGRIGALQVGDKIVVSGSVSNNKTLTVAEQAHGEQVIYTTTTIRFEPTDDILDTAAGLGFVENDGFVHVAGSSNNSGHHLIDTTGSDHVTTQPAVTGAIVSEAAGPSVTLTKGHRAVVAEPVTNEVPGSAPVTLTQHGYEIYQTFTPDHTFILDQIAIPIGKIGNPADSIQLDIFTDSSGTPGTLQLSATLAAASVAELTTWTWLNFANTLTLVDGTTYGLRVKRTGSLDPANYYTLGMIADAYGTCKAWTGAAWVAHPQGVTMLFQVWGGEDTITQIKRVLTDCGQFFTGVDDLTGGASGVFVNQYVEEEISALDQVQKLLDYGMSDGRRLLVTVTPERVVRIEPQPTPPVLRDRWTKERKLKAAGGGLRPRGVLPVGEWIELDGVPASANSTLNITPAFVDVAEYSPATDEMELEFADDDDEDAEQG